MDNQINKLPILNRVQPSPWEARPPKGLNYKRLQRLPPRMPRHERNQLIKWVPAPPPAPTPAPGVKMQGNQRLILPRTPIHFREDRLLFKDLNMQTLRLTFPHIHPKEIEAALSLSKNNLSESIKLIQMREMNIRRNRPFQPTFSATPKVITYIPTKYSDVQIVETVSSFNDDTNIKVTPINQDILKILQTCNTEIKYENRDYSQDSTITMYSADTSNCSSVNSMVSPTTSIVSSEAAQTFETYVEECALIQRVEPTPKTKVGIVIKKMKSGLCARLL